MDTWQAQYEINKKDYFEILKKDAFSDWEKIKLPGFIASAEFLFSLKILFAGGDWELARPFLQRTFTLADRAIREDIFEKLKDEPGNNYYLGKARVFCRKVYANTILNGDIDAELLRSAAQNIREAYANSKPVPGYGVMDEYNILRGVLIALVVGDGDLAAAIFNLRRGKKRYNSDFFGVLKQFVENGTSQESLDALFEYLKKTANPNFGAHLSVETHTHQFELALLYYVRTHDDGVKVDKDKIVALVQPK